MTLVVTARSNQPQVGASTCQSVGAATHVPPSRTSGGSRSGGPRGTHLRAERAREDAARTPDLDPDPITPPVGGSGGGGDDARPHIARVPHSRPPRPPPPPPP